MVHRREIDGEAVVFGNQGALWGNAMTWFDHATGSVWSQPLGEAIAGPLKGTRLETLPVTLTEWASWRESHPDTLALDVAARRPSGFQLADMSIVVELVDDVAAFPVEDLWRVGVANEEVGGVPLAVAVDPADDQRWAVYSRTLDDVVVTLEVEGDSFVDVGTGSHFDPRVGRAIDGPLEGQILDVLPGFTSFLDDYFTFWPDGRVWQP